MKKRRDLKTKRVKKSHTRKKINTIFIKQLAFAAIAMFILLAGYLLLSFSKQQETKELSHTSGQVAAAMTSITPTSAILVSPTPAWGGYCMYAPVILYHYIEPLEEAKKEGHAQLAVDTLYFENHLKYLSENGYTTLTADQLVNALLTQTALPQKSIVVTLDDGYDDAYTYAFPLAKKYNIHLNLMIPTGLVGNAGYVTWGQLKEMVDSGLVSVYNHTWSHFSLPSGDIQKIETEITTARTQLEEQLGKPAGQIFTYPYGTYDTKSIEVLRKLGYVAAFTTEHSYTQCDSRMLTLFRNHVGNAPLSSYGL